jgi:hypothetical protein
MKPLSTVSWLLFTIWKKGYNTLTLYNAIQDKLYLNLFSAALEKFFS